MIKVEKLSKSYKHTQALKEMTFSLNKGKVIGLLGVSGSGKSTLFKTVTGIENYHGTVTIDDSPINEKTKAMTSFLTENNEFPKWMSVKDLIYFYKLMYKDFNELKLSEMIEQMRLKEHQNKKIRHLSKGILQKFRLALVLSRDAKLFLLDEPLGGIDPLAREEIIEMLSNQIDGESTMLISTHLISEVECLLDEVIFINDGKILGYYDCDEIRSQHGMSIDKFYKEVLRDERTYCV